MKPFCRDTWVEVNLDAIRANVETFRSHIPASTSIIAVVKADGYGHGSVRVGEEALASGAESLAVAMLDEAIVLREAGIEAPILSATSHFPNGLANSSGWVGKAIMPHSSHDVYGRLPDESDRWIGRLWRFARATPDFA